MNSLVLLPCPICGNDTSFLDATNTDVDVHLNKYGKLYEGVTKSAWKVCGICGFVHQNPRPSKEALNEFYLQSGYHSKSSNDFINRPPEYYLKFSEWYYREKINYAQKYSGLNSGAIFDVGFGHGGVLRLFHDMNWNVFGVESDKDLFEFASTKLGLPNIVNGIVDSRIHTSGMMDLIFSNHTFEHVADLHEVISGIRKIIRPGGLIFTAIPTHYRNRSNQSKLWMNSSHYNLFTHNSLNNLLARYGFEEITHTYRGWYKEIDDLWHIAKFTGKGLDPKAYYDDPEKMQRYVNVINPINTLIWYPLYSHYSKRVEWAGLITYALTLLFTNPKLLITKLKKFTGVA